MISEKYEFEIACRHEDKTHRKTISAAKPKSWYIKHAPRTTYVLESEWKRVHPEMLDQIARDIAFMDRTGFVQSRWPSPLSALNHKYDNDYSFYDYSRNLGFDHTTAWRTKGQWPQLVITEPYSFQDYEYRACDDFCSKTGYRYKAYKPSGHSLWNDMCYMIFWWHSNYYEPDFDILMPTE